MPADAATRRFRARAAAMLALPALLASPALSAVALGAPSGLPDFTGIVERNSPAVVKIIAAHAGSAAPRGVLPDERLRQLPDLFREFFDAPRGERGERGPRASHSAGSGFIISSDGYVITNHHVIEGAEEIVVRLRDRREHDAELVGSDERSDIALLRIDVGKERLPFLALGQPAALKVGEWVLAIGSPFDLDYSVTAGIVSALGRSLPGGRENYTPFIQTDVAINPGNSGGPLFNMAGEVIGVNSQIFTQSGGSIGVSFAIPVTLARKVVHALREHGEVVRGWLGVVIQAIDRDLAESFELDRLAGALVSAVEPDGPADRAGVLPGDVIVAFAGREISVPGDLPHVVGLLDPGSKVWAKVMRDGKPLSMQVAIGELKGDESKAAAFLGENRYGLVLEPISPSTKRRLRIDAGLSVREVLPSTPAQRAGFRVGDVITMIVQRPVASLSDFDAAMEDLSEHRRRVAMRVIRQGHAMFLVLKTDQ